MIDELLISSISCLQVEIYMDRVRSALLDKAWAIASPAILKSDIDYIVEITFILYFWFLRDLFDLSKDNLQIKENKMHGIFVNGVTEVVVLSFPTPNCFSIR